MTTRAAQRTITSVLAGVVITISVAWLSATGLISFEYTLVTLPRASGLKVLNSLDTCEECSWCSVRRSWNLTEVNGYPVDVPTAAGKLPRHAGKRWGIIIDSLDDISGPNPAPMLQEARGWPWLALQCSMTQNPTTFAWTADNGFILSFPPRPSPLSLRVLPYRPIWPGLLANTALFAALFAGLTGTARASRRALRRLRGLCPVCTYDLNGNTTPGCPECGHGRGA